MYDIILKKRNGYELTDAEIEYFVKGAARGDVPDYELTALLMAVYFRGMNERETATLTDAMARSGDRVDLSRFGVLSADKHSTGGVGDKTTLIVAPLAASLGVVVAKMSGRGLGHTGGTVDKLESVPGYRTTLTPEEFMEVSKRVGVSVIGQSGNMTPADKKLYALRDVTATVDSIPLIASSVMSKKLAAGAHNIVLDVKVGSGAFMKSAREGEALACEMVKIGKNCGRRVTALLTDMDAPLGRAVGNTLEVKEALSVLKGETGGKLRELCVALAAEMASMALGITPEEAKARAEESLDTGAALGKMREWVSAQGGDTTYIDDPTRFPEAACKYEVKSGVAGYVRAVNAEKIGIASVILGAGREKKDDKIDHAAGIVMNATVGERLNPGDTVMTLHTNNESSIFAAEALCREAVEFGDAAPEQRELIYGVVR